MKFRKRPVVIEAEQFVIWDINHVPNMVTLHGINYSVVKSDRGYEPFIRIPTLEGEVIAKNRDWVIKGVQGEFYPCKPDIFEETYELVQEVPCQT